ncbi:SUKH-3 domain-containing protein [Kribbella sp. NPDC051718]|uniref:SUKH-3 domain-containing protein n=1 Tax=Kribbella sp. NPDC051718 TaxID=3155168 RepID=UPI003436B0F9
MNEFELLGAKALAVSGWREGRRVAVDRDRVAYLADGYEWSELVEALLAEFGGLSFGKRYGDFGDVLTVDAALAISGIYKDRVEEYEEFLNLKLLPVGVAARGVLTVMVSPDGTFRGGYDDGLDYLGASFREALGRLTLGPGRKLR